jgi:hypothetical protein
MRQSILTDSFSIELGKDEVRFDENQKGHNRNRILFVTGEPATRQKNIS